jgi:hypothetical protein
MMVDKHRYYEATGSPRPHGPHVPGQCWCDGKGMCGTRSLNEIKAIVAGGCGRRRGKMRCTETLRTMRNSPLGRGKEK